MKINQIKKIRDNLYEIQIINGEKEHLIKLDEDLIIKYQLYHNKMINEEEFSLINSLANYSKIYTKTLNYIAYKMRTEDEVISYLKKQNCSEPFLSEIVTKLKKLNYINDQVFGEMYVKHQFDLNKKGPQLIKKDLINKRIDEKIILNCLEYITQEMIKKNINHLITYYDKMNKNKSINKLKETILRNLIIKGYDYDNAIPELNNYSYLDNNNDEALLEKEVVKAINKYRKKFTGFELKNKVIKALLNKGFLYDDIINVVNITSMEG